MAVMALGAVDTRSFPGPALAIAAPQKHQHSTAHMHHGPRGAITQQRLYCQTTYFLQIHASGIVNGTKERSSRNTIFNFIAKGVGKVSIQGVYTGRYLCMDLKGRLYGSQIASSECIFVYRIEKNMYNTYYSYKHSSPKRRWYVAISKRGIPRRGYKSRKRHKSTKFLVMDAPNNRPHSRGHRHA